MEQKSPEWFEARRGKIKASEIWRVTEGTRLMWDTYMRQLEAELAGAPMDRDLSGVAAVANGQRREDEALAQVELRKPFPVLERVGFVLAPDAPYVGASPDAIAVVEEWRYGVEVKCPVNERNHRHVLLTRRPYSEAHLWQCLAGMWCCGTESWQYLSYFPEYPDPERRLLSVSLLAMDHADLMDRMVERCAEFWRLFQGGGGAGLPVGIPTLF